MKAYMLMTKSGPIVVLTSHASILDTFLLEKLADKGIKKFIAYEIPIGLAELRYGAHFTVVRGDLRETDDLRVLDEEPEQQSSPEKAFRPFKRPGNLNLRPSANQIAVSNTDTCCLTCGNKNNKLLEHLPHITT